MGLVISIINTAISLLTLLIFIYSLLSYFLDPYHPIRQILARVVEPMLTPIRQRVQPMNGLDLSPLILIILLHVLGTILVAILRSLR